MAMTGRGSGCIAAEDRSSGVSCSQQNVPLAPCRLIQARAKKDSSQTVIRYSVDLVRRHIAVARWHLGQN